MPCAGCKSEFHTATVCPALSGRATEHWTPAQYQAYLKGGSKGAKAKPNPAAAGSTTDSKPAPTRKVVGEMNKTERRYAQYLEARKIDREILEWKYEPYVLRLPGDKNTLRIDFVIVHLDRSEELVEIKAGWATATGSKAGWKEDARIKMKQAGAAYWWKPIVCRWWDSKTEQWLEEWFREDARSNAALVRTEPS